MADDTFEEWAIVEIMGHRRLAGRVTETRIAGAELLRIDVPDGDGFTTQFYGGNAVFCLTPVAEEVARAAARRNQPEPVHRWELPAPAADVVGEHGEDLDDLEPDDDQGDW